MFCGLVSNDLGVYVLQLLRLVDSLGELGLSPLGGINQEVKDFIDYLNIFATFAILVIMEGLTSLPAPQ
jgi:hypothetical protein